MEEENIKISGHDVKLLIRFRLDMEADFSSGRKKKSVFWGRILEKMKTINPNVDTTKEQLQRKFLNLFATYKRIKKRNKSTGRNASTWEFFEDFNEVYGKRHAIEPPSNNLIASLEIPRCSTPVPNMSENVESDVEKENEQVPKKRPKRPTNDALQFFKEEAAKEQARHDEVMKLETKKLEIEKEKIKTMLELQHTLEALSKH